MKFVIWGAGRFGKRVLNYLTKNRVAAFIESNTELQGTKYKDIPIISYSVYKQQYVNNPIIVSPINYTEEILDLLYRDGIEWAFSYYKNMNSIMGFLRQAPLNKLTQKYLIEDKIYIYGFNPLGILMYDYFVEKGVCCKLLFQKSFSEKARKVVETTMEINAENISSIPCKSKILLALNLEKEDEIKIESDVCFDNFVDIGLKKELYYNSKIEKFKNIYSGKRCFIVATGPSLKIADLDVLHKYSEKCISVNRIFKGFDQTQWRPDYYVLSDPLGFEDWKEEIVNMNVKAKFISDIAWQEDTNQMMDNLFIWHIHHELVDEEPEFSDDFAKGGVLGGTVVYEGALPLAVYMGFKEIYLLGVDCNYSKDGKNNYFIEGEKDDVADHREDKMILAYKAAKKYADSHGIKIYNATRGGMLEVFERVNFNSLF